MTRAASTFALTGVLLLGVTACETLLGPPLPSSSQVSLASVSRIAGRWRGTWRNTRGASGSLIIHIGAATTQRVTGSVQFSGATCPQAAPFEGGLVDGKLTVTADLGAPCGAAVLTIVESRAEEPRLVGSYKTDYPESGLFAIYPR